MGPVALAHVVAMLAAVPAQDTAYFQQGVDYRIEAALDESAQQLRGRARLRYTNNAPAALDTLWLHQHLNAFRPNSAWARREAQFDQLRFQQLGPDDHAYERFSRVEVDGRVVTPVYPGAPDSTVVGLPLPRRLAPGESVTVVMDWTARTSTVPRRQGRRGRHWDFAQWYPRIAVFDRGGWRTQPLLPQGEFYGEFAAYDVTLDVAADHVIGATGVPVEGDPGWAAVAAPGYEPAGYARDVYTPKAAEALGLLGAETATGRKRVRWRAEDVHHFAWSTSPLYRYEGGRWEDVLIHVLYQPGDTAWDEGVAVQRTARALEWFDTIFGDYLYPQVTNVHRIEGGGTEFPMLIMDGSASQGLIVHEVGHIYAHGMLANNEWLEGWLDEGLSDFLTVWFAEAVLGSTDIWPDYLRTLEELERSGTTQPIATPSADFVDFRMYGAMTYTKPSVVLRMLREYLGEPVMRRFLRTYFDRFKLQHVRGEDFEAVAADVAEEDLTWFFDQWIRRTDRLDYQVGEVATSQLPSGRWRTRVQVIREGEAWMPVALQVGDVVRTLHSRERSHFAEVETAARPDSVTLDPSLILLDYDRSNNSKAL